MVSTDIDSFNTWFDRFREMVNIGISKFTDSEVGDLFAEGSYLNAMWEMFTGADEIKANREKMATDNLHAILMSQREEKAVNQKDIAVRAVPEYLDQTDKKLDYESRFIIRRQQTKALAIAIYSLSRELSRRAK